jgi:hypothetical protein
VRLSVRERRMKCTNATKFYRKSGGAKWRDLQFNGPPVEMFFGRDTRSPNPHPAPKILVDKI